MIAELTSWRRSLGSLAPLCLLVLAGCNKEQATRKIAGGVASEGKLLMAQYQCSACHAIPGVPGAQAGIGPPLAHFAQFSYIAGTLPNLPGPLTAFLINPQEVKPGTIMPAMGVSADDARHMAAYLYTLR